MKNNNENNGIRKVELFDGSIDGHKIINLDEKNIRYELADKAGLMNYIYGYVFIGAIKSSLIDYLVSSHVDMLIRYLNDESSVNEIGTVNYFYAEEEIDFIREKYFVKHVTQKEIENIDIQFGDESVNIKPVQDTVKGSNNKPHVRKRTVKSPFDYFKNNFGKRR